MEARVLNNSNTENIYIVFKSSEDANTPEPSQSPILPNSTSRKPVNAATMNLFVWTDPSLSPIWSGVVPTKVQKVIVISPETKEVSYDGVTLPSGFAPITDPEGLVGKPTNNPNLWDTFLLIVFILIVMAIIYFFWWRK